MKIKFSTSKAKRIEGGGGGARGNGSHRPQCLSDEPPSKTELKKRLGYCVPASVPAMCVCVCVFSCE